MRIAMTFLLLAAFAVGVSALRAQTGDAAKSGDKRSIKEVMKLAHKEGLLKKITEGSAEQSDKQELLALYVDMWDAEPPKGSPESWQKLTGGAIVAAARVVVGKDGAVAELKERTNCAACHKEHKAS
jgi:hypothetical protein